MGDLDVLALDRDLQRTANVWRRWQRALTRGEAQDWNPFAGLPDVARRSVLHEVTELPEADPLRHPLRRWVYRLAEQRINRRSLAYLAELRHHVRHAVAQPEGGQFTIAELTTQFLTEAARRGAWLDALSSVSDSLSRAEALLWERRHEIACGMPVDHADTIECPTGAIEAAQRWLDVSDELLSDTGATSWSRWVELALGEGAREGWPARLTPRALAELLRETTWLDRVAIDPGPLPAAIGPASFLRGLAQVGCAWGEALATPRQPFVIATDPYRLRSAQYGTLFATLPLHPAFVRRSLTVSAPEVRDHLRGTARVMLLASRLAAARALLRGPALAGTTALREAYPEVLRRACGLPLPGHLAAVLVRLDVEDGARFAGWLLGGAARERQVQRHDEDWFRNPRTAEELRDEVDLPPAIDTTVADLDAGIDAWSKLLRSIW